MASVFTCHICLLGYDNLRMLEAHQVTSHGKYTSGGKWAVLHKHSFDGTFLLLGAKFRSCTECGYTELVSLVSAES